MAVRNILRYLMLYVLVFAGIAQAAEKQLKAAEIAKSKPYILTPKPASQPKITSPKVFGVRPGNPFLFTITATGQRPMLFEVKDLPKGLTLDKNTGIITGVLKKEGEYKTTVIAANSKGKAERAFNIIVGNTICLTPPMGWNSWNCWGCAIDEKKIRTSAKMMVDSGLINHGWSYINIDDCWMRKPDSNDPVIGGVARDEAGNILSNSNFPDMKGLTNYIHSLGLKAGIYISPGPTTCQHYEGSWQHETQDAQQFANWGFDYLKYDWCGYRDLVPKPSLEQMKKPYKLMREKLDMADRDIVYSICQYGKGDVWKWGAEVGGNCWRTTRDIEDTWKSMAGIGFKQAELYSYAGPGNWNDPDMLVVGKVGWGPKLHDTRLTPDEQYTHISLWCLLSAPLLIGCPIEQLDNFTINLLTNDEVLEINQDSLGQQARRMSNQDDIQIWAKEMEDGSKAVGVFNLSTSARKNIKVDWSVIGLDSDSKWQVRDLWRQKNLGVFSGHFSVKKIPPHGVYLVRLFSKQQDE